MVVFGKRWSRFCGATGAERSSAKSPATPRSVSPSLSAKVSAASSFQIIVSRFSIHAFSRRASPPVTPRLLVADLMAVGSSLAGVRTFSCNRTVLLPTRLFEICLKVVVKQLRQRSRPRSSKTGFTRRSWPTGWGVAVQVIVQTLASVAVSTPDRKGRHCSIPRRPCKRCAGPVPGHLGPSAVDVGRGERPGARPCRHRSGRRCRPRATGLFRIPACARIGRL